MAIEGYKGEDLGLTYTASASTFKLWAPMATRVLLHIYADGEHTKPEKTYALKRGEYGVWEIQLKKDLKGKFYTFQTGDEKQLNEETPGIYVKATGVNGKRGAILDFSTTNPVGWTAEKRPPFKGPQNAVIYEMQIRDFTIHSTSGASNKGKFVGAIEPGLKVKGLTTGIDHLVEMGVTHVHLLPVFDFRSLDETTTSPQYNWGYDPLNYNVPEGTFATNPRDPGTRIREFKEMVMGFHKRGIRVILDVVYNHTGLTGNSSFNLETKDYYYRQWPDGKYADASACGNETASEKEMMRKFMIESCKHWVKEYHIDGFRFDLMGIHDITTMNSITNELKKVDSTLLFYGEGWTAGGSPLPEDTRAVKANTHQLNGVSAFSDDLRDGLKGSVFNSKDKGFISGKLGLEMSICFGLIGSIQHPEIDYSQVNYSKKPWAREPWQAISYVSCHDNNTFTDKLKISRPDANEQALLRMNKLGQGIVILSQGIPFIHAGEEFGRTKFGVENSYNSSDSINALNWSNKINTRDLTQFYQRMLRIRKEHPAFRLGSAQLVQKYVHFPHVSNGVIHYLIEGKVVDDPWGTILVIINGNENSVGQSLPVGNWRLVESGDSQLVNGQEFSSRVEVPAQTLLIFQKN